MRRRAVALAAVALVAACLRAAYVAEVHDHPYYDTPLVDAADFHGRALQVMRGTGLGTAVYYKAPAYAWLLGQWFRVAGSDPVPAYILQMAGGVLTAVLIAVLAMQWFGITAGLVAGLFTALNASLPYFENQLLIESLALTVSVACVYLLALPIAGRVARPALDLGAGCLAGLALQLRPVNVVLVLALVVWLVRTTHDGRRRGMRLAAVLVPVALLLLPTLRHNYRASGRIVPISVNGGINFFIGNNPDYDSTVAIRPGLRWEELTARFGAQNDPVQWQRNFYRASLGWMRDHPVEALRLQGKKLLLFLHAQEIDRNQDSSSMWAESRVLRWAAVPWWLLAIPGLVGLIRVRALRPTPILELVLLQMLGVLAFFVTARYRSAVVPWMAIAAAVAIASAWRVDRVRGAIALAVALGLVLPDWTGAGRLDFGRPDFELAEVLARRGDRDGAMRAYERAVVRHPGDPDVHFRYGEHLERFGRLDAARAEYERASALAPWSYKPMLAAGGAALQQGNLDAAEQLLRAAEERGDPTGRSLYDLGLVQERRGDWTGAGALYTRSAARPDVPREHLLRRLGIARTLYLSGDRGGAAALFARLESQDSIAVNVEHAEVCLRAGDANAALARLQPRERFASDARALFVQARALHLLGQDAEARRAAERAVELVPHETRYRDWIQALDAHHAPP